MVIIKRVDYVLEQKYKKIMYTLLNPMFTMCKSWGLNYIIISDIPVIFLSENMPLYFPEIYFPVKLTRSVQI